MFFFESLTLSRILFSGDWLLTLLTVFGLLLKSPYDIYLMKSCLSSSVETPLAGSSGCIFAKLNKNTFDWTDEALELALLDGRLLFTSLESRSSMNSTSSSSFILSRVAWPSFSTFAERLIDRRYRAPLCDPPGPYPLFSGTMVRTWDLVFAFLLYV